MSKAKLRADWLAGFESVAVFHAFHPCAGVAPGLVHIQYMLALQQLAEVASEPGIVNSVKAELLCFAPVDQHSKLHAFGVRWVLSLNSANAPEFNCIALCIWFSIPFDSLHLIRIMF